jgi:hypothetical protein
MIVRELKGGSLSKTAVELHDGEQFVRKYISKNDNREYGLVRWQSQIRKLQVMAQAVGADVTPKIISLGYQENDYYYDIEYLDNAETVLDYLLTSQKKEEARHVFSNLMDVIERYKKVHFGSIKGAFSLYIQEEVVNVINEVLVITEVTSLTHEELTQIHELCSDSLTLIKKNEHFLQGIKLVESLTHGNLTLENTMVDNSGAIKLIDLYAETYCESWLGDISQLMQSCIGNYELINDLNENEFGCLFTEITSLDSSIAYLEFRTLLNEYTSKLSLHERIVVDIFYASQFIRMFPFKRSGTPRKAFYFLVQGLKKLNRVLNQC